MARRTANPARTLGVFFLGVAILYGLVALAGSWTPALGLDLEGGTRIRLAATGDDVTPESLDEAAGIIDDRVNGSGVSEAEVTTEGNQYIVVEIPGESRRDLVDTVKRTAQLRFRVVAMNGVGSAAPSQAPECERFRPALAVGVTRRRGAPPERVGHAHRDGLADEEEHRQEPPAVPAPGRHPVAGPDRDRFAVRHGRPDGHADRRGRRCRGPAESTTR